MEQETTGPPILTVFRSRLLPSAEEHGYSEVAQQMEQRARTMPGFVDFKSFVAEDGERLSLVRFDSSEHQQAWRDDLEHRDVQRRGRTDFYAEYSIVVCEERSYRDYRHQQ